MSPSSFHRHARRQRRGAVLIMALLIIVVLVGLALVQTREVRVELQAAGNMEAAAQARAVALAGARAVMAMSDNPPVEAVPVGAGVFWVVRPNLDDDRTHDFGVVVESGKVNLNAADEAMLLKLPHMTESLAGAIIEWRDRNAEINTTLGVESEHYLTLPDAYRAKDDDLETIEELLLVRGFTALEIYGEDANRNGVLDANEDDGDASLPPDNADGQLDPGLLPFVTVYSREPQASADGPGDGPGGQTRIDVNGPDRRQVERDLERMLQPMLGDERADDVADDITDRRPIRNMIDLFYKSRMTLEEFDQVSGSMSVGRPRGEPRAGLININTAPRQVLMTLPNLTEAEADALIARRSGLSAATDELGASGRDASIAWITEVLERDKAIAVADHLTTSTLQRSADIVAVAPGGRAFERYRLVYDVSQSPPRVLLWQRLTHLGWPLDRALLEQMRAGGEAADITQSTEGGVN